MNILAGSLPDDILARVHRIMQAVWEASGRGSMGGFRRIGRINDRFRPQPVNRKAATTPESSRWVSVYTVRLCYLLL